MCSRRLFSLSTFRLRCLSTLGIIAALSVSPATHADEAAENNAEQLSIVMQRVSSEPGYADYVQKLLGDGSKKSEFLTPDLLDRLRKLILGKDWQRVDHFPSLTISALNQSVAATLKVAGSSREAQKDYTPDLGAFALGKSLQVSLDSPVLHPTYQEDPDTRLKPLPYGLVMGDGPDPALAPFHAQSTRLAQVLNRLALNPSSREKLTARFAGDDADTAEDLLAVLSRHGESITVDDDRFFANFGHLHDRGRDVIMPFWIDSQIIIPGEKRSLSLPVSHSDYELHIRGPQLNADVSFYFGIDGKAEFRTMDTLNQPWVMGRQAHVYTGEKAQTAVRMLSQALRLYLAAHNAHPDLAFGGYYTLGVCQDASAAVEQRLEGATTLFPITHDPSLFPSPTNGDREFFDEFQKLPNDRSGRTPAVDRVLGALPTTDLQAIALPGLQDDLLKVAAARKQAPLRRSLSLHTRLLRAAGFLLVLLAAGLLTYTARYFYRRHLNN